MSSLVVPRSRAELAQVAGTGTYIAGGTDLLAGLRDTADLPPLVDLTNLTDPPPVVTEAGGAVEISALAPLSAVVAGLGGRLPALAQAVAKFGSVQIRNRATIGGNLANASPAADTVPPLVAAGATAVVESPRGRREVPVAEIATGPGQTSLDDDEWIATVRVPLPAGEEGFLKLGSRAAMIISVVSLAWRWRRLPDGALAEVRLAYGAVAPTVVRARHAERVLEGRHVDPAVVEEAVAAVSQDVSPIDDVRASAWYRREMAAELLRQALETVAVA